MKYCCITAEPKTMKLGLQYCRRATCTRTIYSLADRIL